MSDSKRHQTSGSSPATSPDEVVKDLDAKTSDEDGGKVSGGVAFTYGKLLVEYKPQNPDGSLGK